MSADSHEPDEQLLRFVGMFLERFGRKGMECTLRISGFECKLIFPEEEREPDGERGSRV